MIVWRKGAPVGITVPWTSYSTITISGSVVSWITVLRYSSNLTRPLAWAVRTSRICSRTAERYLLRLTHLSDASPEQIIDLLRPCFQSLATSSPTEPAGGQEADHSPSTKPR